MTTMLQLVQQATAEMGLGVPTAVASSAAADTVQQLALLNAVGYELLDFPDMGWQALQKAYLFPVLTTTITGTTVLGNSNITLASSIVGLDTTYMVSGTGINQATYIASTPSGTTIPISQAATVSASGTTFTLTKVRYAMPSDFYYIIDDTQWDKSKHWKMQGPCTPQQWQWLLSGYISTGPRIRFRIFGNYFQIWPNIGVADTLGFEYVSNQWALDASSVAKTSFTADTDTCIFPDRLMVLGLKLKYFAVKGFDTRVYQREYDDQLSSAFAADAGSPTLSMCPKPTNVLIGWANIPDSGYGT